RQVIRVQARLEVGQYRDRLAVQAEQFAQLRVVHLVADQIPVPQAQLAGLQGQGQAGLALAQRMGGLVQLQGALGNAHFQLGLRGTQLAFGMPALFHFAGQLAVQLVGLQLGLAEVVDQRQVVQAAQQVASEQAVDLQAGDQQAQTKDQAQQAPAAQGRVVAEQQEGGAGQHARQGEGQEGGLADRVGRARAEDGGGNQAEQQGLLQGVVHRQ